MATKFPITVIANDGVTELTGEAEFPGPATPVVPPINVPPGVTTALVFEVGGGTVLQFDAATLTWTFLGGGPIVCGPITAGGQVDASNLGPSIPYVTVGSAPPTTYTTPLVYDSTAITGGLYAWDGLSAYQKVTPGP